MLAHISSQYRLLYFIFYFASLPPWLVSSSAQLSIPFAVLELCRLDCRLDCSLVPTTKVNVTFSLWFSPLEGLDWRSRVVSSKKFLLSASLAWSSLGNVNVGFPSFLVLNRNKIKSDRRHSIIINSKKLPKSSIPIITISSLRTKAWVLGSNLNEILQSIKDQQFGSQKFWSICHLSGEYW